MESRRRVWINKVESGMECEWVVKTRKAGWETPTQAVITSFCTPAPYIGSRTTCVQGFYNSWFFLCISSFMTSPPPILIKSFQPSVRARNHTKKINCFFQEISAEKQSGTKKGFHGWIQTSPGVWLKRQQNTTSQMQQATDKTVALGATTKSYLTGSCSHCKVELMPR